MEPRVRAPEQGMPPARSTEEWTQRERLSASVELPEMGLVDTTAEARAEFEDAVRWGERLPSILDREQIQMARTDLQGRGRVYDLWSREPVAREARIRDLEAALPILDRRARMRAVQELEALMPGGPIPLPGKETNKDAPYWARR